jgi:DNA polymerase
MSCDIKFSKKIQKIIDLAPSCNIDIETFSEVSLKQAGGYRYSQDSSTEIMCLFYQFGHGNPVHGWVPLAEIPDEAYPRPEKLDKGSKFYVQEEIPADLLAYVLTGRKLCAWNAQFERLLLSGPAGKAIGFPQVPAKQWFCTMAKGAAMSIPQDLYRASRACKTWPKDETGKQIMLKLCKPRKPSKNNDAIRWTIDAVPDDYRHLYEYCADDVRAESSLDDYMPDLNKNEIRAYRLDQVINDRGVRVDLPRIYDVQFLVAEYKARLVDRCIELTGLKPSQTEALSEWIREGQGYDIENLQAATVRETIKDPDCPQLVKKVLKIYNIHNMKAVTKYPAMERAACDDERLHGMFVYHGASTGRWTSRIVQLQNLFRSKLMWEDPETGEEVDEAYIAIDQMALRDLDFMIGMWPIDVMSVMASCVRGMLIPAEGHDLMCLDFGQIEARVLAWLAGQDDVVESFRQGLDIYKVAAAQIYRIPYEDVDKSQRFIGKIAILALGYQGGKVAFAKMAKQYGVEIAEEFADQIKEDWRKANRKTVSLWYDLQEQAAAAIANPGAIYSSANGKIMFKVEGDWLSIRLPSGRKLSYYKPELRGEKITFMGINTYTRQWCRCDTYGGKLAENVTQAIARDLLLRGMFKLEKAGYPIIGTVHDEVIIEIPEGFGSLDDASDLMCDLPDWADDLPVIAEGFIDKRYHK